MNRNVKDFKFDKAEIFLKDDISEIKKVKETDSGTDSDFKKDVNMILANDKDVLKTLENLYQKYTQNMDDITNINTANLKRTFDEYMGVVEDKFSSKIGHQECSKLKSMFQTFDNRITEVEKINGGGDDTNEYSRSISLNHYDVTKDLNHELGTKIIDTWEKFYIKDNLKPEFFTFYTLLVRVWLCDHIKKSHLEELTPCKILILRSLIKRKFNEEMDLRYVNKEFRNYKTTFKRAQI